MLYYCTLFDSNYINKGIALYLSIERYTSDFVLYIMAMDKKCFALLKNINLKNVVVECIEDIENGQLLEAKNNRSRAEYCWTCGSVVTEHFFRVHQLPEITYLDSDLQFFCNPKVLDDELKKANASVGLSPHFINNTTFGIYCVQYVYFRRDENGVACLEWWKDQCLKWCYSRLENGKYGDQKYLDYFSKYFENVYSLKNRGAGIANWNMDQYKYNEYDMTLKHKGDEWPIVFFHYNGVNIKIENGKIIFVVSKYFPFSVRNIFFNKYAELLQLVYSRYLGENMSGYKVRPQNRFKVCANRFWLLIRRKKIGIYLEDMYMNKKYSQRQAPYSERNIS